MFLIHITFKAASRKNKHNSFIWNDLHCTGDVIALAACIQPIHHWTYQRPVLYCEGSTKPPVDSRYPALRQLFYILPALIPLHLSLPSSDHLRRSGVCPWPAHTAFLSDPSLAWPLHLAQRSGSVLQNLRPTHATSTWEPVSAPSCHKVRNRKPTHRRTWHLRGRNATCAAELWYKTKCWQMTYIWNEQMGSESPKKKMSSWIHHIACANWWNRFL